MIFLKYISDSFEDRRAELARLSRDKESDYFVKDEAQREQVLEDKDAYAEVNVFWVPPKERPIHGGGGRYTRHELHERR